MDDIWKTMKKEDVYPFLAEYYKSIGRTDPPAYETYSLAELKKCCILFRISLEKSNPVKKKSNPIL